MQLICMLSISLFFISEHSLLLYFFFLFINSWVFNSCSLFLNHASPLLLYPSFFLFINSWMFNQVILNPCFSKKLLNTQSMDCPCEHVGCHFLFINITTKFLFKIIRLRGFPTEIICRVLCRSPRP